MRGFDFGRRSGLGVIAGAVSGCLDTWDFDCPDTYRAFVDAAVVCGLGDVVQRICAGYEDETPNAGRRWLVRYPTSATWSDCTLARRPGREGEPKVKTLIELPCHAIVAPSNGGTHPTGKPYVRLSGGFDTITTYTEEERDALIELARSFDHMPRRRHTPSDPTTKTTGPDIRPGDDYNQRTSWAEVLEPRGWAHVFDRDGVSHWRRPGKSFGVSATINFGGSDLFYPFTSSTEFEPERSYSKFGAYALLEHGGDFHKAAHALDKRGYGQDADVSVAPPARAGDRAALETPVELGALLDEVEAFVRRFVVLSDHQAVVVALWIAHTHALDAFDCTPYEQVTSATKRAGKTRLLEVQEPLVARPWLTGRTSAAALVRKVDKESPTLLLDESDAAFGGEREYAETLRGVLNTGYQRSGRTTLCVGQGTNITFRDFSTFGAKAIAGIGQLPGTVADRAIPIELKRRTKHEPVERFRARDARRQAKPIYAALVTWSGRSIESLRAARPQLPPTLNDRAQDVWEPLLAIADLAGDPWPARARCAAVALMGEVSDEDINIELLHDIYTVFEAAAATFISSTELVGKLAALDSRPWGDWKKGKAITTRAVAVRLKAFGIVPRPNTRGTARGYDRDRFEDAWARYPPVKPSDRQNTNGNGGEVAFSTRQTPSGTDGLKMQETPIKTGDSDTLTLAPPDTGTEPRREVLDL